MKKIILLLALSVGLLACTRPAVSPSPSVVPSPSATPSVEPAPTITSSAAAAALVLASDPRFGSLDTYRADMIGQSAWYEAFSDCDMLILEDKPIPWKARACDRYGVVITFGWGDCPAGCISRHIWRFAVEDSVIELVSEEGPDVPPIFTVEDEG